MYVENGKISNRQTLRLFVFDLMGIATLLIPPYLAKLCGVDGIFAVLAGALLGFVYLFYLGWIMKRMGMDLNSYLRSQTKPVVRGIVLIFVMVHSILTAGFCGYVFAKLMQYSLIQESSFPLVLLVIMILAAYAVSGGIESRARVYEVLFWFVLVPYVAMMLASVKNFEIEYVTGFSSTGRQAFLEGVYLVFLFFTPLFFALFLIGEKEKNYGRNVIKTVSVSICIAAVILLGSYILLIGNFGRNSLSTMQYPVVTLMSTVQFKGNFLKRMDSLMLAVWFFTLYALLNLHLHYGANTMKEIFSKKKKTPLYAVLAAVLVYGVGYCMYASPDWVWTFVNYYSYIAVPVMVAGPGIVLLFRKKMVEH